MRRGSLLLLGAAVLVVAGCGAETAGQEGANKPVRTYRVETVTRFTAAGQTHEFRTPEKRDAVSRNSESVNEPTGCRTITVDRITYSELPPESGLPAGKSWVRFDQTRESSEQRYEDSLDERVTKTSEDGSSASYAVMMLFEEPTPSPDAYLDELRSVSAPLELIGREEVRGVATTRYRTTVDTNRRTRKALESSGWKAANIERYLSEVVSPPQEVEAWVDADGRVLRVVATMQPHTPDASTMVVTTEFTDFGLPVDVHAPRATEVVDEDEWQRASERRLREELDDAGAAAENDAALPGGFEPTGPVAPPRCLH